VGPQLKFFEKRRLGQPGVNQRLTSSLTAGSSLGLLRMGSNFQICNERGLKKKKKKNWTWNPCDMDLGFHDETLAG
jgi:hypothetical protein